VDWVAKFHNNFGHLLRSNCGLVTEAFDGGDELPDRHDDLFFSVR
jgi:hypothetical protein